MTRKGLYLLIGGGLVVVVGGVVAVMRGAGKTEEDLFRLAIPEHGQWMVEPIIAASRTYGVSPFLLGAIVAWESDFGQARGYTPKGAADGTADGGHGHTPWQIDDRSHAAFLATADLTDINVSTDYAVGHVLMPLIRQFGAANIPAVLAGYNAGAGAVKKAIARGDDPGSVTTATPKGTYVDAVLAKLDALKAAAGITS
jgi:hypothetical protein